MKNYVVVMICCIFLISCSGQTPSIVIPEENKQQTFYIIFEKEFKGEVFGEFLNEPIGVALDYNNNVYISDAGNDRIIKFDSSLNPIAQLGGYGSQDGLLNYPTYLTFDNGLNLMVSDENNRRISRFNSRLNFVDNLDYRDEEDLGKFGYPAGIAFTEYGELWVADRDNNQISIFNNIGSFDQILGDYGYAGGQLKSPENIRKDSDGNFLVCDAGNQRLIWFDEYGNYKDEFLSKEFSYICSAISSEKHLYVLDRDESVIFVINESKEIVANFGPRLAGDNRELINPSDIMLIQSDKLIITDTGNNRLVVAKIYSEK